MTMLISLLISLKQLVSSYQNYIHIQGTLHTWLNIALHMWNQSRLDNITVNLEPGQQSGQAGYNVAVIIYEQVRE